MIDEPIPQAKDNVQRVHFPRSQGVLNNAAGLVSVSSDAQDAAAHAAQTAPILESKPNMDDKDVSRLEDRIAASEERSQLRLEAAMSRVDASLSRIVDQNATLRSSIEASQSATRTWGQWIIATVIVTGLSLMALGIAVTQVWVGGIQVGQTTQAPGSHSSTAPPK